jgi:hypothetical protein
VATVMPMCCKAAAPYNTSSDQLIATLNISRQFKKFVLYEIAMVGAV